MSTIALTRMPTLSSAVATRTGNTESEVLALFTEHGPAVFRFCRFTLASDADAEDVVQDSFLKLLEHLRAGGDRGNLRGWLFTVAANGCRDRVRARRRWLPWTAEWDRRLTAPADDRLDGRALAAAARTLTPRDRLLLALRAQGLSYREIASASGIREQSVGRLLARAIDRCRRALGNNAI